MGGARVATSLQNGTHECAPLLARGIGRAVTRPRRREGDAGAPDDADLARRSVRDAEAFGLLYDRHCAQIYRFVYRRLGDVPAAEDVTAEVFVKALKAIASYRPDAAPFAIWLRRIAANAVVDHVRARRPTVSLDGAPADREAVDPAAPVEEQAISRVEADRVWRAVDALPDAQRTAVVLRHGGDLPIAAIAARMNRTEGAVKLLLNRGMAAVREQLRGAEPEEGGS